MKCYVDSHCHILPGIDDGAKDETVSLDIASKLVSLGFGTVIATPHYYNHRESVEEFVSRRNEAFSRVNFPEELKVLLAAEVSIEEGMSKKSDLTKLVIPGTDRILVEFPMKKYSPRLAEEIFDIKVRHGLTPVVAHFERYDALFTNEDYSDILSLDGLIYQVNLFSLAKMGSRKFFRNLYNAGVEIITGTDAHKTDFRITDSEKGMKKLEKLVECDDYERILRCEALGLH